MLKVGITGVDGFVGAALYSYLEECNYDVIGFSRRKKNSEFVYWDISGCLQDSNVQIDVLVHCAGIVDDWATYEECYKSNCLGTRNVLESFPHLQKFIYISSCSVYDPKDKRYMIDENFPCGNFLNGYSQSKYEAEKIILKHESKCQKIILRPHVIYGANDKKIIPRLLRACRFHRFIVLGNGDNHISITHIDNLCLAIKNSIDVGSTVRKIIFNISDLDPVRINDLLPYIKKKFNVEVENYYISKKLAYLVGYIAETIFKLLRIKTPPFITRYIVNQMTSNHFISIDKAKNVLKYNPRRSFVDF